MYEMKQFMNIVEFTEYKDEQTLILDLKTEKNIAYYHECQEAYNYFTSCRGFFEKKIKRANEARDCILDRLKLYEDEMVTIWQSKPHEQTKVEVPRFFKIHVLDDSYDIPFCLISFKNIDRFVKFEDCLWCSRHCANIKMQLDEKTGNVIYEEPKAEINIYHYYDYEYFCDNIEMMGFVRFYDSHYLNEFSKRQMGIISEDLQIAADSWHYMASDILKYSYDFLNTLHMNSNTVGGIYCNLTDTPKNYFVSLIKVFNLVSSNFKNIVFYINFADIVLEYNLAEILVMRKKGLDIRVEISEPPEAYTSNSERLYSKRILELIGECLNSRTDLVLWPKTIRQLSLLIENNKVENFNLDNITKLTVFADNVREYENTVSKKSWRFTHPQSSKEYEFVTKYMPNLETVEVDFSGGRYTNAYFSKFFDQMSKLTKLKKVSYKKILLKRRFVDICNCFAKRHPHIVAEYAGPYISKHYD